MWWRLFQRGQQLSSAVASIWFDPSGLWSRSVAGELSRTSFTKKSPRSKQNITMLLVAHFAYLQLLLLLFSQAESIRLLKAGTMIDAEGREYKSPRYGSGGVERSTYSQVNGTSPAHINCTDSSMIIEVNPDHFNRGRRVSFGALYLGGVQHWHNRACHLSPAANGHYVVKIQLQECGSTSTVKQRVNIEAPSCWTTDPFWVYAYFCRRRGTIWSTQTSCTTCRL